MPHAPAAAAGSTPSRHATNEMLAPSTAIGRAEAGDRMSAPRARSAQPDSRGGPQRRPARSRFDGRDVRPGTRGDTLASALLANGVRRWRRSIRLRPPARRLAPPGPRSPTRSSRSSAPFPRADAARHDRRAVRRAGGHGPAGTGPAGRRARPGALRRRARALRRARGRRRPGRARRRAAAAARRRPGDPRSTTSPSPAAACSARAETIDGGPRPDWVAAATAELAACPEVRRAARAPPRSATTTTTSSSRSSGAPTTSARRARRTCPAQRVWRIRARQVVLATGAHERSDRVRRQRPPGHHARRRRPHLPATATASLPGRRAVVFTTNDSAYAAAADLARRRGRGRRRRRRPARRPRLGRRVRAARDRGARRARRHRHGRGRRASPGAPSPSSADGGSATGDRAIGCDLLLVSGGWNPAVHLYSQARGRLRYDDATRRVRARRRPSTAVGRWPASAAAAVHAGGLPRATVPPPAPGGPDRRRLRPCRARDAGRRRRGRPRPLAALWLVPEPGRERLRQHALRRPAARRDGRRRPARDRGRACARSSTSSATRPSGPPTTRARRRASSPAASSPTPSACDVARPRARPRSGRRTRRSPSPRSPGATAAHLHDPERVTPLHEWHVARGRAVRGRRAVEAAVVLPARRARTWRPPCCGSAGPPARAVALMDASTLGKIEVQGPDAGELLDRSTPT